MVIDTSGKYIGKTFVQRTWFISVFQTTVDAFVRYQMGKFVSGYIQSDERFVRCAVCRTSTTINHYSVGRQSCCIDVIAQIIPNDGIVHVVCGSVIVVVAVSIEDILVIIVCLFQSPMCL